MTGRKFGPAWMASTSSARQQHELRLLVEAREFAQQVPYVGPDAEIIAISGVNADPHLWIISRAGILAMPGRRWQQVRPAALYDTADARPAQGSRCRRSRVW